jgi:uncharacterized protein (TIGR03435 family)
MGMNCRAALAAAGLLFFAAGVGAQTPRFEAASVKRNTSGSENGARNLGAGGRLVFTNMTLDHVIAAAFEIEQHQLLNAPRWTSAERFDIIATAGTAAPLPQLYAMLRTLLAERFRLTVHTEERIVPSYVLSRAREGGCLGAALKPATVNCGPTGRGSGPGPTPGCSAWIGPGIVGFAGQPIANLAGALSMMLQQPVVDRTGLEGGYDIDLKFSTENLPGIPAGPPGGPGPAGDPNTPTIFAALQEQLGLRLESQRAPITVVIVDSVSLPTED